jgi:hypothetical protein
MTKCTDIHNKKANKIMQQINVLSDLAPEEVPEDSQFLLEINFSELSSYHLETQKYWTLAVDAASRPKHWSLLEGHEPNGFNGNSIQRFLAERS